VGKFYEFELNGDLPFDQGRATDEDSDDTSNSRICSDGKELQLS
jgi:hypothetical protein